MKVLAIGTKSSTKKFYCTGQSVMFDGLVDYLNQHEVDLDIIDIAPNNKRGLLRILDFLFTFIGLFFKLLSSKQSPSKQITFLTPKRIKYSNTYPPFPPTPKSRIVLVDKIL